MRLFALHFLNPKCKNVRPGASSGGQPPIVSPTTLRFVLNLDREKDVVEGLPILDLE